MREMHRTGKNCETMKTIVLILLSALVLNAAEPRNEMERAATVATRIIYGFPVDISPVLKWQRRREGDRPMPGWRKMTGKITRDMGNRWEMEVTLDGEKEPVKIILNNPPVAALREFTALKAEHGRVLGNLTAAKADLRDAEADRVGALDNYNAARSLRVDTGRINRDAANQNARDQAFENRMAASRNEMARAGDLSLAIGDAREFDPRGYTLPGQFIFTGYAVKTKEVYPHGNQPVYDHGTYR